MKMRKIIAAIMSAAMIATAISVPAYAAARTETATVAYQATTKTTTKAWDGKSAMKENVAYALSKNATISSAVSIPKGATLTVKKGAKLTIGEKGALTVNGTLTVQSGATLAVNGKLTVASGKTLKCGGTMTLGKKAVVSIKGRFYLLSSGKLSGTPSKVSFDVGAAVVMAGTNSSKSFTTAVNKLYAAQQKSSVAAGKKVSAKVAKKEIAEHYNRHLKLLFTDRAYINCLKSLYSDADYNMVVSAFQQTGSKVNTEAFFYDNVDTLTEKVLTMFTLNHVTDASKIKSVSLTVSEVYDCTSMIDGVSDIKNRFGNVTQCWGADANYNFTMKDGSKHKTSNAYIYFVYVDGKLQLISELFDDASYK